MYAVEFKTQISNGKIDIPIQYHDKFNSEVKVILLKAELDDTAVEAKETKIAKGFGKLAHRANPSFWDQEENAWERVVVENYDND